MEHTALQDITVKCIKSAFLQIIALATKEEWTGIKDQGLSLKLLGSLKEKEKKMLTERTLKLWRKEALIDAGIKEGALTLYTPARTELNRRILCATQELLDAHLIRSGQVSNDKEEK